MAVVKRAPTPHLYRITGIHPVSAGGWVHDVLACTAQGVTMDLNYFLSRHQVSLMRASAAPCAASRASHRALAAGYAGRIRELQLALDARASVIAR